MSEQKRSYYRNWYQHWQEEKKREEKEQAMKYFSQMETDDLAMEQSQNGQLYSRQGQLYQKRAEMPMDAYQGQRRIQQSYGENSYGNGHAEAEGAYYNHEGENPHQRFQEEEIYAGPMHQQRSQGSKKILSKKQTRQLQDMVRGILIGLPVVIVMLVALSAAGVISPVGFLGIFSSNDPAIVAYAEAHNALMLEHNALNQSIFEHVSNQTLSEATAATLQNDYQNIQTKSQALMAEHAELTSMTRLWSLKLQSLEQMMLAIGSQQQANETVIAAFNQFVDDQNDIGTEMSRALSEFLSENNVDFTQQPGGGLVIQ